MRQLKITKSITNRENKSIDQYLQEISKGSLLTPEEEGALARRIREGDLEALEQLTTANLRFVVSVAKQHQSPSMSLNDLINSGNLGLVKAAQRFDETRGFKFISYAVWWIRQSIFQELAEHGRLVRIPINMLGNTNKVQRFISRFANEHGREPTIEEIVDLMKISIEDAVAGLESSFGHSISLDAHVLSGESDTTLGEVFPDHSSPSPDAQLAGDDSMKKDFKNILENLSEKESKVIELFFGLGGEFPQSLDAIGETMGLSRERVRQIKDGAIKRLRSSPRAKKLLRKYLGQ